MKKTISILGSTKSIGLSSLKIIDSKKNYYNPYLLSSNKNYRLICNQINKYKPKFFLVNDKNTHKKVKKKFKNSKTKIINSLQPKILKKKTDITVSAIPGVVGLNPTILMIKKSKKILIANKESIICGWDLIKKNSKKYKTEIVPIDSEHFSILNLMGTTEIKHIDKVYLTASGGPFLGLKLSKLRKIKPTQALKHPKWKMGKKITIDSSTLMNKVLEYIEAQKLFQIPSEKLEILIHPESLVHAIIKFKNGLVKFIYHDTSMIIPLANAIFKNDLEIENFLTKKNKIKNLTFKIPNKKNFPIISILNRVNEYPSTSIIINAANEILVDHFLRKKIPFLAIPSIIKQVLKDSNYIKYAVKVPKDLEIINNIDSWSRSITLEKIRTLYGENN